VTSLPPATLVVGGTGLLGRELVARRGDALVATRRHSPPGSDGVRWVTLDLADRSAVDATLSELLPSVVINAAYARVGPELGAVTARAPGHLAESARAVGARLVHLSTDVVFAGDRSHPYVETDRPDPVHDYGRAKATAEHLVTAAAPDSLIVRTSLLYGSNHGAQEHLVGQAATGDVTFFTDEIRCPAHVADLAEAIARLVAAGTTGIVHLAGADAVDRLTLARLLAPRLGVDPDHLRGGTTDPGVVRPRHLVLATDRADLADVAPLPGCRARLG